MATNKEEVKMVEDIIEVGAADKETEALPKEIVKTQTKDKEDFELKTMREEIAALKEMLMMQSKQAASPSEYGRIIKVMHLVDNSHGFTTHIELSNLVIDMVSFGEERNLTLQQAEELIGTHRRLFELGILTLTNNDEDFAKRNNLKTVKDYPMDSDFIKNIGKMSPDKIRDIFERLPKFTQDYVISRFVQGCQKKDGDFTDMAKLNTLNSLTGGKMQQTIEDLGHDSVREEIAKNKK